MSPTAFVKALASVSFTNVFNPYADTCAVHDRIDGANARQKNLRSYLEAVGSIGCDTIWMGRDLGYRGGRRTGIALTDEHHLPELNKIYTGCKTSQATSGAAIAERTAAEIWAVLRAVELPPLLWNVFPLHPHESGEQMSNRRFTSKELAEVNDLNAALISSFSIRRIIAIGQDAAKYSLNFGVDVIAVRHPSYGGITEFKEGMSEIYDLPVERFVRTPRQQLDMF